MHEKQKTKVTFCVTSSTSLHQAALKQITNLWKSPLFPTCKMAAKTITPAKTSGKYQGKKGRGGRGLRWLSPAFDFRPLSGFSLWRACEFTNNLRFLCSFLFGVWFTNDAGGGTNDVGARFDAPRCASFVSRPKKREPAHRLQSTLLDDLEN